MWQVVNSLEPTIENFKNLERSHVKRFRLADSNAIFKYFQPKMNIRAQRTTV